MAVLSQGSELLFPLRYQQLEEASASLRERIRHLDDMVHCQQKKVKQMVEEVSSRGSLGPRTAWGAGKRYHSSSHVTAQATVITAQRDSSPCVPCGPMVVLFSRPKCGQVQFTVHILSKNGGTTGEAYSLGDKSDRGDLSSGFCASPKPILISCTLPCPVSAPGRPPVVLPLSFCSPDVLCSLCPPSVLTLVSPPSFLFCILSLLWNTKS